MVSRHEIEDFAQKIAERYHPEKIILFGSQARGTATEESDVDLLVLMNFEGIGRKTASDIRTNIPKEFSLDLIVRKPADVEWRIRENDWFLKEIVSEGEVLYEAAH